MVPLWYPVVSMTWCHIDQPLMYLLQGLSRTRQGIWKWRLVPPISIRCGRWCLPTRTFLVARTPIQAQYMEKSRLCRSFQQSPWYSPRERCKLCQFSGRRLCIPQVSGFLMHCFLLTTLLSEYLIRRKAFGWWSRVSSFRGKSTIL